MRLDNVIALIAPFVLGIGIVTICVTIILCTLWVPAILCTLLVLFNAHYECFAFNINWNKKSSQIYQTVSLLTYNVNLAYKELSTNDKAEEIANYLLEKDADLILLQEYNPLLFPVLQRKLSERYLYGSPYKYADRYKAVYSKYPISNYTQLKDENVFVEEKIENEDRGYMPICGMRVDIMGNALYLVNCHLHSNNFSPALRNYRSKKISILDFVRTIFFSLSQGAQMRENQAKLLRNHIDEIAMPILICGDMNDLSGSSAINIIRSKKLKDAWWERGLGLGNTLATLGMKWRLDHILYSDGIFIDKIKIGKIGLSDHRPVLCDFYIK